MKFTHRRVHHPRREWGNKGGVEMPERVGEVWSAIECIAVSFGSGGGGSEESSCDGVDVNPFHALGGASPGIECWEVLGDVAVVYDKEEVGSDGDGGGLVLWVPREVSSPLGKLPPSVVESLGLGLEGLNEDGETVSSALGVIRWLSAAQ